MEGTRGEVHLRGLRPIGIYLEEKGPRVRPYCGRHPWSGRKCAGLSIGFDGKFAAEVSDGLIFEKVTGRFLTTAEGGGAPEMGVVRAALHNLRYHLDYISYLMEDRRWLAGETLTLADLAAAAHLSCLDYVGDVPWGQYSGAKDWYVRIKSRPAFRTILADHVPGMPPPKLYVNLDF